MTGNLLLTVARRHVETMVGKLSGDEDFLPFLTFSSPVHGDGYVAMPCGPGERNEALVGLLALHRATEAVWGSMTWIAPGAPGAAAPSEHADRREYALLLHATPDGDAVTVAEVTRGEHATIGAWRDVGPMGGPLGDAMHMGMRLGAKMSDELAAIVDEGLAEGALESVLDGFLEAIKRASDTDGSRDGP